MENNKYLLYGDKTECNGCTSCIQRCPKKCIDMKEDKEGFLYPEIDKNICINCRFCYSSCSNMTKKNEYENKVYACINKNESIVNVSSSGGMFTLFAQYILKKDGIVYGARLNEKLEVEHTRVESIDRLHEIQKSKYSQSSLDNIFKQVEGDLRNGKYVLFTGTPCQCKGLVDFLKKDYELLLVVDIICHAVPSPKVLRKYIYSLEYKFKKAVIDIKFRDKSKGWHYSIPTFYFDDGGTFAGESYANGFHGELINRPSCYKCKFSGEQRFTDITIGDFWGIENLNLDIGQGNGVSLMSVNSEYGNKIFEILKQEINYIEVDRKTAFNMNRKAQIQPHINREKFFKLIDDIDSELLLEKCIKVNIFQKIRRKLRNMMKHY